MANEKKVLVVDDHFEMLEFLRSMLELSNEDYEVLAVPSAEEGLLELRRMHFDLVITDVRLPGMSGFDLVRRTKTIKSDIPIIMITAYSSTQGRQEAEELGVFRYFAKPLDTDEMLSAVHEALFGESVILSERETTPDEGDDAGVSARVQKRLESLRVDTGAAQLVLATLSGELLWQAGNGRIPDPIPLITILAHNLEGSFLLAEELDSQEPFTLQYHMGATMELYVANVGRDHFLTMFFDMEARRGRIGTVWVFAQRAIKELLPLLSQPTTKITTKPWQTKAAEELAEANETAVSEPVAPPQPIPDNATPVPVVEEDSGEWLNIEPEELADLLTSETELLSDTGDLNLFWDEALANSDAGDTAVGFSWEEARRQGLIPTDLDLDDPAE